MLDYIKPKACVASVLLLTVLLLDFWKKKYGNYHVWYNEQNYSKVIMGLLLACLNYKRLETSFSWCTGVLQLPLSSKVPSWFSQTNGNNPDSPNLLQCFLTDIVSIGIESNQGMESLPWNTDPLHVQQFQPLYDSVLSDSWIVCFPNKLLPNL